jgi:hypothetical protein
MENMPPAVKTLKAPAWLEGRALSGKLFNAKAAKVLRLVLPDICRFS